MVLLLTMVKAHFVDVSSKTVTSIMDSHVANMPSTVLHVHYTTKYNKIQIIN